MLVDSHAHLEIFENLDDVLDRAKEGGIGKIVTIGTSIESSKIAANLVFSRSRPALDLYATVGIHPGDGKSDVEKFGIDKCIEELRKIIKVSNKMVGVGEAGLDYHENGYTDNRRITTDKDKKYQRELFGAQIKLAVELDLPLVVHCRNAWGEIFDIISDRARHPELDSGSSFRNEFGMTTKKFSTSLNSNLRGVFHSFTGGVDEAKKAVELGFYVSFSGIVTFKQSLRSSQAAGLKNAKNIQEAAKVVPLDRILIETDSPYLAPEPVRGSQNEPKNVKIIGQFLAEHLNLPIGKIEELTTTNANSLFKLT